MRIFGTTLIFLDDSQYAILLSIWQMLYFLFKFDTIVHRFYNGYVSLNFD